MTRKSIAGTLARAAFGMALLCAGCPLLWSDERPPADGQRIEKIQIADGIYQFMTLRDAYVRQLNSVVIVNDRDVLVFDTNTRPSSARLILEQIRQITGKPVRYIVNSHWHPDHWSGNEVYLHAYPDAEIIASEQMRTYMLNTANAWPQRFKDNQEQMRKALEKERSTGTQEDGTPLTPDQLRQDEEDLRDYASLVEEQVHLTHIYPNLTYVDQLTLRHGGREFRFMSVTGDAEGTTVLYLPGEKVLITGDVVSYPIPYVTPPPSRHAGTLKTLAQLDIRVIIPGHGPAFHDKVFLDLERELLETVVSGVQDQLRRGVQTLAEVQSAVTAESLRQRFTHDDPDLDTRFRDRVKYLVKIAMREALDNKDYQ